MKDLPDIIRATIAAHHMIEEGDHVILGLSGGPDSLSLFHVLNLMQKEEGHFTLSVVHVDHMFRGEDSREDRRFVENLCRHYRVHCDSSAVDCPAMVREEGLTPEEAGRRARYDAFARAAKGREGVVKVAVAQNRNDQAETILFHLARGTGLDGLCGMDYVRRDTRGYQVIRPLLDAERADIEAYCRQQQLAPRFDSTNQEMEYTRNRIRLGLIPYMEREFNGRIVESIARMGALLRIDRAYLEQEAEAAAQRLQITRNGRPALDREGLAQCPEAIRARALRAMFRRAGLLQDVREKHIRAAEHLLTGGQASGSVDLPRGYRFEVSYDAAMMAAPAAEPGPAKKENGRRPALRLSLLVPAQEEGAPPDSTQADSRHTDGSVCRLDADAMAKELHLEGETDLLHALGSRIHLRTRRPGDWIALRKGRKKLQDLFVDEKIPRAAREQILFVAMGSQILWIPDLLGRRRYTGRYPVTPSTRHVLMLEIER